MYFHTALCLPLYKVYNVYLIPGDFLGASTTDVIMNSIFPWRQVTKKLKSSAIPNFMAAQSRLVKLNFMHYHQQEEEEGRDEKNKTDLRFCRQTLNWKLYTCTYMYANIYIYIYMYIYIVGISAVPIFRLPMSFLNRHTHRHSSWKSKKVPTLVLPQRKVSRIRNIQLEQEE